MDHFARGRGFLAAYSLALLAACTAAPEQNVRVSGDAARQLLAKGATLIEDYGTFQVIGASADALASLPPGSAELLDGRILLNSGPIDPAALRETQARTAAPAAAGKALRLVQFVGPVRKEWHEALVATGVRIVSYLPNDAYLVYGDAAAVARVAGLLRELPFVRWDGPYLDTYKLDRSAAGIDTGAWSIQLVEDPGANDLTLAAVALVATGSTRSSSTLGYVNLVIHCDAASAARLAARPDVVSIQPYVLPALVDERQDVLISGGLDGGLPNGPGYLAWLAGKGFTQAQFTASGFGVDVSDTGVDNGTTTPNHFALYVGGDVLGTSRVAYNRLVGTPSAGSTIQGCDGHGNLNAHIVGGYANGAGPAHVDAGGYQYGLGVAPFVRIGSSVVFDPSYTFPDFEDLQSRAWSDGMRVSSNSWGASTNTYTADAQRYDALVRDAAPAGSAAPINGNQEMAILFAAGNDGSYSGSIGSPGTAKNVLTVGGTENVRAFGGSDACGIGDTEADSVQDIAPFSSRGPCSDGRRKPDLVAPATHVTGGVAQAASQRAIPPASATGAALGCFNASAVCAGVGNAFFPPAQQWYTASTGTSHSTPAVAGAAALVRQYFVNHSWAAPSPAMTKAYLMASARYLSGIGANDTLPSNAQGMGLLDLGMAFDGVARMLSDQEPANLVTASGETRTFSGWIADPARPLRVTLAWTDAPGSTAGSAWNNDLDLSVTVGGTTYKGNVFSLATSIPGGTADRANNVESVFLPPGLSGAITVTVTAANVNSDGVPGNGSPLDQDFALVGYNVNVCATPPPPAPTGVTATPSGPNQVDVGWTPNGSETYRVFRAIAAGGPYTEIGTAAAPPFQDLDVSGGATYYYVVRAANCATSGDSNEASAVATGECRNRPAFAGLATAASAGTVACGVSLAWSAATPACGGAMSYDVHRSLSPSFVPGIANRVAAGVAGTSFTDLEALANGVTYYYLLRAIETGAATVSDTNMVVRSARPAGVAVTWFDDFDANRPANAGSYWIATTGAGIGGAINLVSGCRYQSPSTAYRYGASSVACGGVTSNSSLATLSLGGNGSTPGVNGFSVGPAAVLTFNQWYSLESYFDGAWLVYSTTSAAGPWTFIPDTVTAGQPYITAGLYDRTISGYTNRAWSGTSTGANGALRQVSVNLEALADQTVWFGWMFKTDSSVNYEGFYIDDVGVTAHGSCNTVTPVPGLAVSFSLALPATVGAGEAATFEVTARDVYGQRATSYAGTASISSSDGQAVLPAPLTFTGGIAEGSIVLRTAGSQTVAATSGEIVGSVATAVTAAAPAQLRYVTQPSAATAGAAIAPAVAVHVQDRFGNRISANAPVTVALGTAPGGAILGGALTVSAVDGAATYPDLVLRTAGAGFTLVATGEGLTGATSEPFDVRAGDAIALEFATSPAQTPALMPIVPAPVVRVRDAFGNTVVDSSVEVSVAIATHPAAGTLSGASAVAASGGFAAFPGLSIDVEGSGYVLSATAGLLVAAMSAPFDVGVGPPASLAFVAQPTQVQSGATLPPVTVELRDAGGYRTAATDLVMIGFATDQGEARLLGTQWVAAVDGVATFSDLSIDRAGSGFALMAVVPELPVAVSEIFDVTSTSGDEVPADGPSGGCSCGAGGSGGLGLLLPLAGLGLGRLPLRRRRFGG